MQIGLNQNVEADGRRYHVQTEDVPDRSELVTQVFVFGRVVHSYRSSYAEWKREADWEARAAELAKKQHAVMVAGILRGRLKSTE